LAGADGVQHPLGRVGVGRAVGAVLVEVVEEDVSVSADVAKVYRLPALLQQQQAVKVLEQRRIGLVNGAEDSLSSRRELLKETDDVERALRVQSGRRLVEEEKEFRFRGQLNTDRNALALLDR